tara:strand:- start:790 stop:1401 length:612 start_codon:yes stop_codon:yes gene_type:complete
MYVIFIHITGLALIEILFYFFYIGNMETQMFIKNIKHLLKNENLNINYNMYNTTLLDSQNYTFINYYQARANNGEQERIRNNNKLFTEALLGFIIIITITFVVVLVELMVQKKNIKKIRSLESVNNICLEMVEYNSTNSHEIQRIDENPEPNKYIKFVIHAILYAGLMIAFEYWFFNAIIMKYKVISNEEIEYLFAEKIDETI